MKKSYSLPKQKSTCNVDQAQNSSQEQGFSVISIKYFHKF